MSLHRHFESDIKTLKTEMSWNNGSIQKCIFQLEVSGMCLFYEEEGENVTHIVDACEMLAQMDDVAHGNVCLNFHCNLIKSHGFGMKEKWYCL